MQIKIFELAELLRILDGVKEPSERVVKARDKIFEHLLQTAESVKIAEEQP